MADFKVIHGSAVIANAATSITITDGVDYTLESGSDATNSFVRITSSRLTGGGRTSGGGNQNTKDVQVSVTDPENIATSITFTRYGSTNDCRVSWEIVQYIGPSGGANEIVVRRQENLTVGALVTKATSSSAITTIADNSKVAVFILGQCSSDTGRTEPHSGLFTSKLIPNGSDWDAEITRGWAGGAGTNANAAVAVVEFTGSNWRNVQRVRFMSSDHGATPWVSTGPTDVSALHAFTNPLLDVSKTFLHPQYRYNSATTGGTDDIGETVTIASTANMKLRRSTSNDEANKLHAVWVIENTQTGTGAMAVQHHEVYRSALLGVTEANHPETITAVSSIDTTSIWGTSDSCEGTAAGTPRGFVSFQLTTTTNVDCIESEEAQENWRTFDVVEWPDATPPVGPGGDLPGHMYDQAMLEMWNGTLNWTSGAFWATLVVGQGTFDPTDTIFGDVIASSTLDEYSGITEQTLFPLSVNTLGEVVPTTLPGFVNFGPLAANTNASGSPVRALIVCRDLGGPKNNDRCVLWIDDGIDMLQGNGTDDMAFSWEQVFLFLRTNPLGSSGKWYKSGLQILLDGTTTMAAASAAGHLYFRLVVGGFTFDDSHQTFDDVIGASTGVYEYSNTGYAVKTMFAVNTGLDAELHVIKNRPTSTPGVIEYASLWANVVPVQFTKIRAAVLCYTTGSPATSDRVVAYIDDNIGIDKDGLILKLNGGDGDRLTFEWPVIFSSVESA